jgi:hypothetical protein
MPTFQFYHKGRKLDEVVGADIGTIKAKLFALAKSAGSGGGGAFNGKGYVLGTGAAVQDRTAGARGVAGQLGSNWMWLVLVGALVYKWYTGGTV